MIIFITKRFIIADDYLCCYLAIGWTNKKEGLFKLLKKTTFLQQHATLINFFSLIFWFYFFSFTPDFFVLKLYFDLINQFMSWFSNVLTFQIFI